MVLFLYSTAASPKMSVTNANNGSSNCTLFTNTEIESLARARGITALICVAVFGFFCALIIVRWFRTGRKKLGIQERLFVYVAVGTFLPLIGFTVHGFQAYHHHGDHDDTSTLCAVSAYLVQSLEWIQLLVFSGIVVTLLLITCHEKWGFTRLENCCTKSRCRVSTCEITTAYICEVVLILFAVVFSFIINIIPFALHDYGEAGPWCWIKSGDSHDCTKNDRGFWEQIFLWYVEFAGLSISCILMTVVTLCCTCYKGPGCSMGCKTVGLLLYLFVSFLMGCVEMAARIIDRTSLDNSYELWMAYAVLTPFSKLLLPVVVAIVYLGCFNYGVCGNRGYGHIQ